jgi:hypothetical protein
VDVNGFVEVGSSLDMNDSVFYVYGDFRAEPGIDIYETGASSLIAAGDSIRSGQITLKGGSDNPIQIESDYSQTEFIVIEEDASANSVLQNIDFLGGWCNIQINNNRLNEPIRNCRFISSDYAVYQDSTDQVTDVRFCFFYWNIISVYAQVNGAAQEEISFKFDNLTIDNNYENQSYGIVLSCLQSPAYINQVGITNNIITNSYCGWYIGESFYPPNMANIAYCDNDYNHNLADPNFQSNPMYLSESPFETPTDPNGWPYFLDPNSPPAAAPLQKTMLQNPQQMLTSIFRNPAPRGDFGIGYGVALPDDFYSEIHVDSPADFNDDGNVNFDDFFVLAADWLTDSNSPGEVIHYPDPNGYAIADIDKNRWVDSADLDALTRDWLGYGRQIYVDVNDTPDRLFITCREPNFLQDSHFAVFLDGVYLATREPENNPTFIIDKRNHQNGEHRLKAIVLDGEGNAYAAVPAIYTFDTPLSGITYEKFPDPAKPFIIRGCVRAGNTATLSIKDMEGQVRWSEEFTEDFVAVVDPNQAFEDDISLDLAYTCVPNLLLQIGQDPPFDEFLIEYTETSSGSSPNLTFGGKPINAVAGLILCMVGNGYTQGTTIYDTGTCRYAERTMKNKGIYPIVLLGYGKYNQVTYEMITMAKRKFPGIRYLHINAHGNYLSDKPWWFTGNTPRTRVLFNDGVWLSHNSRRWTGRGRPVPENYQFLSDSLEKARIFDEFNFVPGQIRILILESCYGLRNVATMDSNWLVDYVDGAYEYEERQNPPLNSYPGCPYTDVLFSLEMTLAKQVAIGSASPVVKGPYPFYTTFFNSLYQNLMTRNFYDAYLFHVLPDITNDEVMDEHRIRGLGFSPLNNVWLSSNPNL